MTHTSSPPALGFYGVVHSEATGWTGGLLVLNETGRPLEFRCTLPVRPTKTHEILFGPTIRDHLIGEVIASVLLKSCRCPLSMILCRQAEAMALDTLADCPVALVRQAAQDDEGPIASDMIAGAAEAHFAGSDLLVAMEHLPRVESLNEALPSFPDVEEPFDRIHEAIREAHSQLARAA
ncbi:hypothetical protein [Crateriforma conspicua]|uniref:Uncharacterized protein n=1 Tax=Crateriforma conspicua TaxID=2527996 RepID=A0A5C5Y8J9_9PLAN|nr:hypothetical protein [Crateriforma conspicua]QDV64289.1 hypothetical protein Mal65_34420 [Crateriforma conspicua]TWT69682.1 hypothetical protein Pan14r_19730 [Crateriforma conspicua]